MKIIGRILSVFLIFALLMSGCGNGGSANKPEDSGITVGVCLSSFNAGFMTALNQAAAEKGEELGMKVYVTNANGDPGVQADNMQNFITQGVSAIIVNPIDSNGIIPSIQMANKMEIPVFIMDTNAAGGEIVNRNGTDNLKAGQSAAQWLAERLYERNGEYKGKVVNLCGKISQASGYDRDKGFMDEIAEYPGIEVVFRQDCGFDQEKSMNAMMNALQANDHIDGVYTANDNTALGAIKAIEQSNRYYPHDDENHIYLIGNDGNPEGIQAIRDGRIDATISQNPITMGENTIQMIYDMIINGTTPEAKTESPQILITRENIDSVEVQEFGIWADELRSRTGS